MKKVTQIISHVTSGGMQYGLGDCGKNLGKLTYKCRPIDILPETRASFFLAFGITPDEQVAMEERFSEATVDILGTYWPENVPEIASVLDPRS